MDFNGKREKYNIYNTLAVIPVLLEGRSVFIDLRNETSIAGRIYNADGYMNIILKDCIFIDQKGLQYEFDEFMVTTRNLRQIHIPNDIDINIALSEFLNHVTKKRDLRKQKNVKQTQKEKRTLEKHEQTLKEIYKESR